MIMNKLDLDDPKLVADYTLLEEIIESALNDLAGGYVDTYYFECDWPTISKQKKVTEFGSCYSNPFLPTVTLIKPADVRINPFTNEVIKPSTLKYPSPVISSKGIKTWVTSNLPNYS